MDDRSVTEWLTRLRAGEAAALHQILPLVYEELRRLARSSLRRERAGHTLGATALVHEAFLRLAERSTLAPQDRRHFLAIAAQSMRRILVEHARARKRQKRNAGRVPVPLADDAPLLLTEEAAGEVICLDDALDRLAGANPRAARVVELRFFAGLTLEQSSETLGISLKTVQRDWLLARAWLRKEMGAAAVDPLDLEGDPA